MLNSKHINMFSMGSSKNRPDTETMLRFIFSWFLLLLSLFMYYRFSSFQAISILILKGLVPIPRKTFFRHYLQRHAESGH